MSEALDASEDDSRPASDNSLGKHFFWLLMKLLNDALIFVVLMKFFFARRLFELSPGEVFLASNPSPDINSATQSWDVSGKLRQIVNWYSSFSHFSLSSNVFIFV